MIEFKNISKKYLIKKQEFIALDNLSFTVKKSEIYGIIGLSGAGKTTILKLISGLEKPTMGDIIMDNNPILSLNRNESNMLKKQIGIVFQGYNLLNQKTVYQNVSLPLKLQKTVSKEEIKLRVDQILTLVGLENKKNHYPRQLSGGQKQRVAIARSLITNPKILLLDEPTSALDSITTKQILKLIKKINVENNVTILIITHNIDSIRAICDDVLLLNNGKKVFEQSIKSFNINEEELSVLLQKEGD